jgi:hypothetical protein
LGLCACHSADVNIGSTLGVFSVQGLPIDVQKRRQAQSDTTSQTANVKDHARVNDVTLQEPTFITSQLKATLCID